LRTFIIYIALLSLLLKIEQCLKAVSTKSLWKRSEDHRLYFGNFYLPLLKGEPLIRIILPFEDTVVWRQLQIDLFISHLSVMVLYNLNPLYEFLHYRLKRYVLSSARSPYLEVWERWLLFYYVFKLHIPQSVFRSSILFHSFAEILFILVVRVRLEIRKIVVFILLFMI